MLITTFTKRLDNNSKNYIKNTLEPKIEELTRQARTAKTMFFTLRVVAVLSSVSLPILISVNDQSGTIKTLTIGLSILVAITIGLEESFRFKERYIKLEGLCNLLDNVGAQFAAEEGEFAQLTDEKKYKKYISISGKLIASSQKSLLDVFQDLQSPSLKEQNS